MGNKVPEPPKYDSIYPVKTEHKVQPEKEKEKSIMEKAKELKAVQETKYEIMKNNCLVSLKKEVTNKINLLPENIIKHIADNMDLDGNFTCTYEFFLYGLDFYVHKQRNDDIKENIRQFLDNEVKRLFNSNEYDDISYEILTIANSSGRRNMDNHHRVIYNFEVVITNKKNKSENI